MSDETIIMVDSPEAATFKTVEGWVSRDGRFYGKGDSAERVARRSGATHQYCDGCGVVIPKGGFLICGACREKRAIEKHKQAPRATWDGEALLYSDFLDRFVHDPEEAIEISEDSCDTKPNLESLRLFICEPRHAPSLDVDFFADVMPDDWEGELPAWAISAIDQFNAACAGQNPLSWEAGKYAMDVAAYENTTAK